MTNEDAVRLIAEKVRTAGGNVYYVGGCVRDKLLGIENKDIDIEIHGVPVSTVWEILDSIGERMEFGKRFGIYGLKGCTVDIALPRTEKHTGNGHRDFEVVTDPFMGTLEAARRRDFTINALMEDVLTGGITDHFNGLKDLKAGVIRHIDDRTFVEDPLRVLRAAQFAARFRFKVAGETVGLCRTIDLSSLSRERIMLEMEKALLKADKPSVFFEELRRMKQLNVWFPEVKKLIGVPQNMEFHKEGDAWTHTMMVLDEAAKRRDIVKYPLGFMLSALCHDFGKAVSTTVSDGTVHSYGHETEGLPLVQAFTRRLTSETKLKRYVLNMTELHMEPNMMAHARSKLKKTNKLFDSAVEPFDLIQLSICDGLGKLPRCNDSEEFLMQRYNRFQEIMSRPYVTGKDLIDSGLEPGKDFTEILAYAHKLRMAGCDKDNALKQSIAYARSVLKTKLP